MDLAALIFQVLDLLQERLLRSDALVQVLGEKGVGVLSFFILLSLLIHLFNYLVYKYTCTCIYMHMYVYVHARARVYTYTRTCAYVYNMWVLACVCVSVFSYRIFCK